MGAVAVLPVTAAPLVRSGGRSVRYRALELTSNNTGHAASVI